ncbi:DUF6653 family protein [Halegenticoccus tardaugens]|uniref:DUF6653 family protein n=1 Tax=Halegenticoccus tardaugens TaxID=2071624 RepID=UPI00100AE070|nr:DUF6653 family protein [Halegenticoccus tardaugens]
MPTKTPKPTIPTDDFWDRHSNPKSGWTRLLSYPVLVLALYARKPLLLRLTILYVAVNPVLFRPPEGESDDWMYRGVKAEEHWLAEGRSVMGFGFPQVLNAAAIPVFCYGLYAAYKQKPVTTAVCTAGTMALKLLFVDELIRYREATEEGP